MYESFAIISWYDLLLVCGHLNILTSICFNYIFQWQNTVINLSKFISEFSNPSQLIRLRFDICDPMEEKKRSSLFHVHQVNINITCNRRLHYFLFV